MIIVSSGMWMNQAPGAESVAGVCLLLRPGPTLWRIRSLPVPEFLPPDYTIDLLGTFEHPVDTRLSSYQKAIMMAVTDIPPSCGETHSEIDPETALAKIVDPEWMLMPQAKPFTPRYDLVSRSRRWQGGWRVNQRTGREEWGGQLHEAEIHWQSEPWVPKLSGETRGRVHDLALAQAELIH